MAFSIYSKRCANFRAGLLGIVSLISLSGYAHSEVAKVGLTPNAISAMENRHEGRAKLRFHAWKNLIESSASLPVLGKLKSTNNFFNQFEFISEVSYQGEEDYWKAPDEFVLDGGGDCEDFAIAKYFTLEALGVPSSKLRITYVKSLQFNQAHMVLAYYPEPEADPLILDNINTAILPASKRPDLVPVYSFNANGLWLAKKQGGDKFVSGSTGLNKWQQVIEHMKKGGK